MLGTFSALQAHRASASFFHLGASVGKSHCFEAVMGTRWQHVSVLKELSKIHVPVLVIPSLLTHLIPRGAGFADGGPHRCSFSAPLHRTGMASPVCCWVEPWRPSSCFLIGCKKRTRKSLQWCERTCSFRMTSV